jgi:tRNA (guanine-N7-)-methyltransferase
MDYVTPMELPERRSFSRVRVREHVNPLSLKFQSPINTPHWPDIYANFAHPLHLDIGCGRGRFLLKLAQLQPNWNYLGLEIRQPIVEEANQWRTWQHLTNLHYLFCNANNTLRPLLSTVPLGRLAAISIQFPDPWFKRRHQKRRIVQPQLVTDIVEFLVPGGTVFLQSDVLDVATEMRDRFLTHPAFQLQTPDWLPENPLPVQTEREISTLERGEPVYRTLFKRCFD